MSSTTCLVLMFKAPMRSKRRLQADLGAPVFTVAEHLLACAVEDLAGWRGPVCFAAASRADAAWIRRHFDVGGEILEQCDGNLGERIGFVNARLLALGHRRQIFIGSDCPAMGADYLAAADRALAEHDVVLGPARDGGVVLMAAAGPWPALGALPWSTGRLMRALLEQCEESGRRVALLDPLADVDSAADLGVLAPTLAADGRPARRALLHWLQAAAGSAQ